MAAQPVPRGVPERGDTEPSAMPLAERPDWVGLAVLVLSTAVGVTLVLLAVAAFIHTLHG